MKTPAGKCFNCGARDPVMRAVYDWQRTERDGAWVWLGASRTLCTRCTADPRFREKWIDERQKRTAQKPAWAEAEPEEFAEASPQSDSPQPSPAAATKPTPPAKKNRAKPGAGKRKGK